MMKYELILNFDFSLNLKMLHFVYNHIISSEAVKIYLYLFNKNEFNKQIGSNISNQLNDLIAELNINEDIFFEQLHKLEAMGLIDTFLEQNKQDLIVFKLKQALSWNDFCDCEKFLSILKTKISEEEFEKLKFGFENDNKVNTLVNISYSFEKVFGFNQQNQYMLEFDDIYSYFFETTKQFLTLSNESKLVLNNAYSKYNLSKKEILEICQEAIIREHNNIYLDNNLLVMAIKKFLDLKEINKIKTNFKVNRNKQIFLKNAKLEDFKLVIEDYKTLNSEQYLTQIQKQPLSDLDQKAINNLRKTFKLPDYLINVLIDYCLLINFGRFEYEYLKKVALSINRSSISSINDLLIFLQNANYKRNNKLINNSSIYKEVKW